MALIVPWYVNSSLQNLQLTLKLAFLYCCFHCAKLFKVLSTDPFGASTTPNSRALTLSSHLVEAANTR